MTDTLRGALDSALEMGGLLFGLAPLLLGALLLLLPRDRRDLVRGPLVLFGTVVLLTLLQWLLPERFTSRGVWVVGYGLLLLVIVRSLLLFLTETPAGRWIMPPLPKIVLDIVQALLYLAAAFLTLHEAGMEPGSLLTTSALLTAVLGLALQDTLGNLFSGLALQLGRPFEVGDWVELDPGQAGRVVEVGWRATKIITLDHVEVIVPNGMMAKALLRNVTRPTPVSRRNIHFGASYHDAPTDVRAAALEACRGVDHVLDTPAPNVIVTDFGDSSIRYTLRYYTADIAAAHATDSEVRTRLWYGFRRKGLAFPFPQRDVHVHVEDPADERRREQERRTRVLRRLPLLAAVGDEALGRIAQRAEIRLYAPGERIVDEGQAGEELFVVLQGEVRVLAGGDEVARLRDGEFFGEMSLLTGEQRSATVEAVEPCRLVVVGHAAMKAALDAHPELAERLSAAQALRQRELERHRTGSVPGDAERTQERTSELLARIRAFFRT